MESDAGKCILCDRTLDKSKLSVVTQTYQTAAIAHLKSASRKRKDKIWVKLKNLTSVVLHKSCYCGYIRERRIEVAQERLRAASNLEAQKIRKRLRSAAVKKHDEGTDVDSGTQNTDLQAQKSTESDIEAINKMGVHFMMASDEDETKKPSSSTSENRSKNTDLVIELPQNFDINTHCFFCGHPADAAFIAKNNKLPTEQRAKRQVRLVSKHTTKDRILKFIEEQSDNFYLKTVKDRIENVNLINSRYHNNCMVNFYQIKTCNNFIGHSMNKAM